MPSTCPTGRAGDTTSARLRCWDGHTTLYAEGWPGLATLRVGDAKWERHDPRTWCQLGEAQALMRDRHYLTVVDRDEESLWAVEVVE